MAATLACGSLPALAQQQASSGNAQLERMLVDYHLSQLMRLGMERAQAQQDPQAKNPAIQQVVQQLEHTPDRQFARVVAPTVRDCITEDQARMVSDFLETPTGQAIMGWMVQSLEQPGQTIAKPAVDQQAVLAFQSQGGTAVLNQFSTCVQNPTKQLQMGAALVNFAANTPGTNTPGK